MGAIAKLFQKKQPVHADKITDTTDVLHYVKASMVSAQKGTKCVDGRYLPDQARGMVARPGADGGYVMALEAVNRKKKLGLTPEQCFNVVLKAVKKLHGTFYLHTDHQVDPNATTHHGLIGCGHLAKAARKGLSWEYDVRSNDVKEMVNYARNLCEVTDEVKMVNLVGSHQEKGVLIIHSNAYTVLADNPKLGRMYFIYDQDRDHTFMRALVSEMQIPGLLVQDMQHEADLQLAATLQNLAVGLPIYEVTFVGGKPAVVQTATVEHRPLLQRMHLPVHTPFALRKRFAHLVSH